MAKLGISCVNNLLLQCDVFWLPCYHQQVKRPRVRQLFHLPCRGSINLVVSVCLVYWKGDGGKDRQHIAGFGVENLPLTEPNRMSTLLHRFKFLSRSLYHSLT